MICYSLKCSNDHTFDSWFANAEAYEKLKDSKHLACSICGDPNIVKAIMAPNVAPTSESENKQSPLKKISSPAEQAIVELRKKIEETSEYVGNEFVNEARAIHSGEAPERMIHGSATIQDAKSLSDEGVPIVPLPWTERKTN